MIICTNCDYECPETANFCPRCGNKLEHKAFCTNCGEELIPGMPFCPACGTKAGSEPEAVKKIVPPREAMKVDVQDIATHSRMDNHLYEQILIDTSKNNIDSIAELEKHWNRDHDPEVAAWLGMLCLGIVKRNKPETWKKAVDMLEYADAHGVYTFSYHLGLYYTVFDCQPEKAMLYYSHEYSLGHMRHEDYLNYEEYLKEAGQTEKLREVYEAHVASLSDDPSMKKELCELRKKLADLCFE